MCRHEINQNSTFLLTEGEIKTDEYGKRRQILPNFFSPKDKEINYTYIPFQRKL